MRGQGLGSMARKVAKAGRNGDSVMVHMQPREVAALERINGKPLTINPHTGQPEAFSLWKLLAGIGTVAAGALIPGAQFLIPAGVSLGASSLVDSNGKKVDEGDYKKKLQEQAANFVKIPIMRNIQSPAPTPATGLPGVVPEPIGARQEVSGYLTPPQGFYAKGGCIPPPHGYYASGGKVDRHRDARVVVDAIAAAHGQHPYPDKAMQVFKRVFGDAEHQHFMQEMGGAKGLGAGLLSGPGAGMDDQIPASVDGQQDVMLSDGEYVVPADVVAHLGDGSTKAGAERLDEMRDRVRHTKTGRTQQPGKIDPRKVMP